MEPTAELCDVIKQRFKGFIVLFDIPLFFSDGTQLATGRFTHFLGYLFIMSTTVPSIDIPVDYYIVWISR